MAEKKLRVLIADDHQPFRESLSAFLKEVPCITIVGEAENGIEACEMAIALCPDILVSDIKMPGRNGIEAARLLKSQMPEIKVILFSMVEGDEFFNGDLNVADRFIPKQRLFEELIGVIEEGLLTTDK